MTAHSGEMEPLVAVQTEPLVAVQMEPFICADKEVVNVLFLFHFFSQ
jgi:hypothetical protein